MISFAGGGADSRTTQLFVSLRDSKYLGKAKWETPIGQIVEGMDVVDAWYKGYVLSGSPQRRHSIRSWQGRSWHGSTGDSLPPM
jgi:cyclophilin family peptidyl-prolyl cis-trans isomerase|eukprot:COSAG06_NODE_7166_length_2601_cov_3.119904_3_plen_84_part_00